MAPASGHGTCLTRQEHNHASSPEKALKPKPTSGMTADKPRNYAIIEQASTQFNAAQRRTIRLLRSPASAIWPVPGVLASTHPLPATSTGESTPATRAIITAIWHRLNARRPWQ